MTTHDDRRQDYRADIRTVVNVYTLESLATIPATFMRAWSEDISATGARLMTEGPINADRVWLKFLGQGESDCFIEADIIRRGLIPRSHFRTKDKLNAYGVRFLRLLSEPEFLELSLDQVERVTSKQGATSTVAKKMAIG